MMVDLDTSGYSPSVEIGAIDESDEGSVVVEGAWLGSISVDSPPLSVTIGGIVLSSGAMVVSSTGVKVLSIIPKVVSSTIGVLSSTTGPSVTGSGSDSAVESSIGTVLTMSSVVS